MLNGRIDNYLAVRASEFQGFDGLNAIKLEHAARIARILIASVFLALPCCPFSQSYAGSAAVVVDELDAGALSSAERHFGSLSRGLRIATVLLRFDIGDRDADEHLLPPRGREPSNFKAARPCALVQLVTVNLIVPLTLLMLLA